MNIRNIALVAALVSVAAVSNAQVFELRAGAGVVGYDAATRTFKVQPGQAFTINIVAINNTTTTFNNITTASIGLAFDRTTATSGNSRTNALGVDKKLSVDYANTQWGSGITSFGGFVYPTVTLTEGGAGNLYNRPAFSWASTPNAFQNINGFRPLVLSGQAQVTTPGVFFPAWTPGQEIAFASVRLNNTLAIGEIFGDGSTEAGLQMYNGPAASQTVNLSHSGFAGVGTTGIPGRFGSEKYRVEAVPEPMTMAALGAGLALMARRRRKS